MVRAPVPGLLLDFDGTVADTLPALRRVYRSFLEVRSTPLPRLPFEDFNGRTIEQSMEMLSQYYGWSQDIAALTLDYASRCAQVVAEAPPLPGVTELLAAAQAKEVVVAIVSSGPSGPIHSWLHSNGLDSQVAVVVGKGESVESKPHPAPYATALTLMGLQCHECLAVEDSLIGAESALSAGLPTYVVGGLSSPQAIAVPSMREIQLILEHVWLP